MHRPGGLVLHFHLLVFNSVQNKCQTRIYVKQPKELQHKVREKKIRNFPFSKVCKKQDEWFKQDSQRQWFERMNVNAGSRVIEDSIDG